MLGSMMDYPLTVTALQDHGTTFFGKKQIVTRVGDGTTRSTYAEVAQRARQLADGLAKLGVRDGDRVATLAWNHQQHLELYLAVPCMGAVLHTVNFRLFADQVAFILNDAEDRVVAIDASLLPLLEQIMPQLTSVRDVLVIGDKPDGLDSIGGRSVHAYEDVVASGDDGFTFPALDEQ